MSSVDKLDKALSVALDDLKSTGRAKGEEMVITGVKAAKGAYGPRYFLAGQGKQEFIKMNPCMIHNYPTESKHFLNPIDPMPSPADGRPALRGRWRLHTPHHACTSFSCGPARSQR